MSSFSTLEHLIDAARKVASGDLSARVGARPSGGDIERLAAAFDEMAAALQARDLEARKAEKQVQRQLSRIEALREINAAANASLDLNAVLRVLMEKIDALLPYTAVLVWLRNEENGEIERAGCWNLDFDEWKGRTLTGTPPLVQEAIQSRQAVFVRDIRRDPRAMDPDFYRRHDLVSYLGVPLVGKGDVLGVLVFLTGQEHHFSNEEIRFLIALAGQAAVAIKNSQLYEQTKRQAAALEKANRDLKRKEQIQALLKEMNQDATRLDADSLLKKLTEKVCEFFKADVSDVRILKDDRWSVLGISGVDPALAATIRYGASNRRSRWIVQHKQPLVVADVDPTNGRRRGGTMERLGLRSYVGVPLIFRNGEVAGVLRALTARPRNFTPEEVELMQLIANGAAVALENAMLLEQIKRQAGELEKANRVKDEFLGFVSHELKTPVNLIRGYTELIAMIGDLKPEQEQAIKKLTRSCEDLVSMINGLLEATKIEVGAVRVNRSRLDIRAFLDELRSRYQVPLDKKVTIRWSFSDDLPVVVTDREKLRHILQNLLNNAIKYTERGVVTVSASYRAEVRELVFEVSDTGIGIPREELPFIFQMFRQGGYGMERSRGGVGLGLHIVETFARLLGGGVSVSSEVGVGSTFVVRLPVDPPGPRQESPTRA